MRRVLLPFLLGTLLCAGAAPASADEWADAKRDFKQDLRSERWQARRNAYGNLAFFDGADAVDEILKAMAREKNEAVLIGALGALGAFVSDEAHARMADAMLKSRGEKKLLLLMALGLQKGANTTEALLTVLHDKKDLQAAAQAALALGRKRFEGALPELLPFLRHADWHMRSAAAQAITLLPGPPPGRPLDPKQKPKPWVPEWFDVDVATARLVEALENADGVERGHMIDALHRITKQDFGHDVPAWKQYMAGTDPSEISRKPTHPPYFFGIPVWGKRVVVITTTNLRTDKPHPFQDRARMQEVCTYPGGRDLAWFKIRTNRQLLHAWIRRTVEELDKAGGVKFEFLAAGTKVEAAFGKLVGANGSTRSKLDKILEKLPTEAGNDTYVAFQMALDISGKADGAAWQKGPDQILYATCAIPWLAEVTDPDVVGAAIAMKAARRLVTIHAVGVDEHPYDLMKTIAGKTGGVYSSFER